MAAAILQAGTGSVLFEIESFPLPVLVAHSFFVCSGTTVRHRCFEVDSLMDEDRRQALSRLLLAPNCVNGAYMKTVRTISYLKAQRIGF
jgi:hypothetical protein